MTSLSVIVPTLNEERILPRNLARLRRLMPDAELLVVDGGSEDATARVAAAHARVLTARRGRGTQMNAGAAAARGAVLLFLHADARLRADPRPAIRVTLAEPGCAAGFFRQRIAARGRPYRWVESAAGFRARRLGWILGDLGLFVRSELFRRVGGFPDDPLFEDLSISRRLRRHGRLLRCPASVWISPRRWQQKGMIRTCALNWALTVGYYLGVSPCRLVRAYRAVR